MDTTKTITHIGLCAGYGGIELGLGRVLPTLRSVALCEIEAFPIANLVAKMEAGLMEPAPVWTDLKSFPWESFRDRVDILTGGYPCQPFSAAGKRAGKDDSRHLWPWIADGIQILRPRMCFFENVEGHISLGLREVIGELEEIGYQTAWGIFSASEVGAPHQRKRVFILAVSNSLGGAAGVSRSLAWNEGIAGEFDHGSGEGGRELADASSNGHDWRELQDRVEGWASGELPQSHAGESCGVRSEVSRCSQAWDAGRMADTNHQHGYGEERGGNPEAQGVPSEHWQEEHSRWESWRADAEGHQAWPSRPGEPQHAWEPPRVVGNAESPDVRKMFRDYRGESGEVSDTQQIESGGGDCGSLRDCDREIEPSLGRDSHGTTGGLGYAELCVSCDNRTDELRLLGNGVVPSTAERAFRTLLKDLI